ncbi:hypothetical protein Tco_0621767 [Tanacetum coccineum]
MGGYEKSIGDYGWVKVNRRQHGEHMEQHVNRQNDLRFIRFNWNRCRLEYVFAYTGKWWMCVAYKRIKIGIKVGFVRFVNNGDLDIFEAKLNGIMIGESKLVINKAKFIKANKEVGDKNHLKGPFAMMISLRSQIDLRKCILVLMEMR